MNIPLFMNISLVYQIILFYGMQFNDWFTTVLALRIGAREINPFMAFKSVKSLTIFKFVLASYLLSLILLMYQISSSSGYYFMLFDTLLEGGVTLNNTIVLLKLKVRKNAN